jgi:carboxymethylenebutenolidase
MGLTDWVMLVADQLAAEGYIVVAPDFVSGLGPNGGRTDSFPDVGKVREAISGLPPAQVTGDLNAACDYAKSLPSSNGKITVGGFCWGGTQTFRFATNRSDLSAAFVFYGSGPTEPSAIAKINAPVYGFYGGNDNRINATIPESEKLLKDAGKSYTPVIYEGAGHGFMRAGQQPDAQEANKKARDAAWRRVREILGKL